VFNETYSKVNVGRHLPDSLSFQNGQKQKDTLKPLHLNFTLKYAIRKVLENQVGLELNGTHVDDVNLLGDNVEVIKKIVKTLSDRSKEIGPEVNAEKTKYMLLPRHLNKGHNHGIKITNTYFEMKLRGG
jgi:hypothetical protein